jgi:hypothetical protein
MMILTEQQIKDKRDLYKEFIVTEDFNRKEHYEKYNVLDILPKPGNFFLYETIVKDYVNKKDVLFYPRLAIYINGYVIDMAPEIEYIDVRRTWEYKVEYEYEYNDSKYTSLACEEKGKLKSFIDWSDNIFIYGKWETQPNWKELKKAYQKTIWYHTTIEQNRERLLNNILK